MDKPVIKTSVATIPFDEEFPQVGQERVVFTKTNEEQVIKILNIYNYRWKFQNGQVVGVLADVTYSIEKIVRPSSRGKLKLIE